MASSAYLNEEEVPGGFVRLAEVCRLLHRSEDGAVAIAEPFDPTDCETRSAALGGAKAAVAAIRLEAATALFAFGIWQLWRIFR